MAVAGIPLKFAPFTSKIDIAFYSAFFQRKLDHDKLDDSVRPFLGLYGPSATSIPEESCLMEIRPGALGGEEQPKHSDKRVPKDCARAEGKMKNVNTLEAFKNLDKSTILHNTAQQIWDAIKDGTIYSAPSFLASFFLISYADLKKYRFTYWFAFPAIHSEPQWKRVGTIGRLTPPETEALVSSVGTWRSRTEERQYGFFLAKRDYKNEQPDDPKLGFQWVIGKLGDYENGFFDGVENADKFIAFVDPSAYPENPGWCLRNLLVLVRQRFHLQSAQILCYRDTHARRHEQRSILINVEMDRIADDQLTTKQMSRVTGWERSLSGKLSARMVSVAEQFDPKVLADTAVDLNLKLMKWRIAPGIDLEIIKNTKCLLLGAGTLGGYVARNLMAWGIRHITFVDNGAVSYSNPVRQPLFTHQDCLQGGRPKALRSAEMLKEIYPGVNATGHVISVPMLGHPIVDEDKLKSNFFQLQKLINAHDAIFLLMDTRESRWLPTVMGKAHGKIVLNAALGFDSYVVMRHGAKPTDEAKKTLGCYFCSDVVAPGDSVKDLTLDQQCTVTRPGVSSIASSLLVELFTSVLQHPERHAASAPAGGPSSATSYERDPATHPLGLVPHQIRGFLGSFQNLILRGENYPQCSGCSLPVLDAYSNNGWEFVKQALNEKDYIPELSGLAEVQRQAEKMMTEENWSDEENVENDGDSELV